MTAIESGTVQARAIRMHEAALDLNRRIADPFGRVYITHNWALMCWSTGEWEEMLARLARTEEQIIEEHVSYTSFRTNLQHFILDGQMMTGRWREYATGVAGYLEAARRKGDRFATSAMCVHSYLPALMAGRPERAEELAREGWEVWPQKGNIMSTYWGHYARVEAALYRGHGAAATGVIRREQAELNSSTHYKLLQTLNLLTAHLEGRAALSAAAAVPVGGYFGQRAGHLRNADRMSRRIEKANVTWSNPLAHLLRAGVANLRGRADDALRHLADAAAGFDAAAERMYAAAARRQWGCLLGGDAGRELIRQADEFMTAEGVREPDRIAHMLAPGFPD